MRILTAALLTLAMIAPAHSQQFRTQEFNAGDSHIGLAYRCGVLGVKSGVSLDAMDVVSVVMAKGLTAQHLGDLMTDALDWWEIEGERMAAIGMWEEFCAQPIDNLRRMAAP